MNRTRFYKKVVVDGVEQLDFLYNNLSKLDVKRDVGYYRTDSIDRKRPDIISEKNYGTVYFWWVILVVNGIEDPFFDTQIGIVLKIPSTIDLHNFSKKYRMR